MTIARFTASLKGFERLIDTRADQFVQGVAFECAQEITVGGEHSPGTPVDTGFARASWWVRLGDSGSAPDTVKLVGVDGAILGTAVLDAVTLSLLGAKAGQTVYLLNNADYIRSLEYGHSGQAPQGFVRLTVRHGQEIADKVARRLTGKAP